jgi:hypothetical protein
MPTANDSEAEQGPEIQPANELELKKYALTAQPPAAPLPPLPPRRKRHYVLWTIFVLLIVLFLWLATSSNPFAQGMQELAGNKHDQAIVDTPFSISPHNFRYYKFSLRDASTNVAIVGDFTVSPELDKRKNTQVKESENGVEVYVLSETAFAIWQTGYVTSSVFESGRVTGGKVQADLPAGAGVYYLVFSNKFASKAAKKVDATVVLHYKNWIPDWVRAVKIDW